MAPPVADPDDDYDIAPPYGPRLYAHVAAATLACPRCGTVYRFGLSHGGNTPGAYDLQRAIFTCPYGSAAGVRCGYRAYVGLVLWPIPGVRSTPRPHDHTPNPSEAAQTRMLLSFESTGRIGARRARVTNIQCLCHVRCPVHTAPEFAPNPPMK